MKSYRENLSVSPGPGAYEINETQTKFKDRSPFIRDDAIKTLTKSKELNPGPGAYDFNKSKNLPNWFTIGKRLKTPRKPKQPGPGAYDPNLSGISPNKRAMKLMPTVTSKRMLTQLQE